MADIINRNPDEYGLRAEYAGSCSPPAIPEAPSAS